jgi:hypothetical protein
VNKWVEFLQSQGDNVMEETGEDRPPSFRTLKIILPPTLGGTTSGGGGASGTLKSMLLELSVMLKK